MLVIKNGGEGLRPPGIYIFHSTVIVILLTLKTNLKLAFIVSPFLVIPPLWVGGIAHSFSELHYKDSENV